MKDPMAKNVGKLVPKNIAYPQVWSKILLNFPILGDICNGKVSIPDDRDKTSLSKVMYAENCIRVHDVPEVGDVYVMEDVILLYPLEGKTIVVECPRTEPERKLDYEKGSTPNDVYIRRVFPKRLGVTVEIPDIVGEIKFSDLIPNEGSFTSIRVSKGYSISIKFINGFPQWEIVKFIPPKSKSLKQKLDFDLAEDPEEEESHSSSYELD